MKNKICLIISVLILFLAIQAHAQYSKGDSTYQKYFVGSTFFLLGNLAKSNPPDFVQLNIGYRLSPKDALSLELKTWKYAWSLGIPYGPSTEAAEEKFPGFIREFGFAIAYQRFIWKGLYAGLHAMSAWQSFVNTEGNKIDKGFQVFNTYRLGYHFKIAKDRFFIQPSVAVTHRPFHTAMPDSFRQLDEQWSKFFIGEPGLHFGFNF